MEYDYIMRLVDLKYFS